MTVVIVTGASSGIGEATALRLGRSGMTVVLAARRAEELAAVARRIETNGGAAVVVPTDVRDPAAVDALVERALDGRPAGSTLWSTTPASAASHRCSPTTPTWTG